MMVLRMYRYILNYFLRYRVLLHLMVSQVLLLMVNLEQIAKSVILVLADLDVNLYAQPAALDSGESKFNKDMLYYALCNVFPTLTH